jgi:hypothetical protein
MRLRFLFAVWLVCASIAAAQDAPKRNVRFFNDSAKAVNFYVDGQFGCSVPANPEENNAYWDPEIRTGQYKLNVKGRKLHIQSCELFVGDGLPEWVAFVNRRARRKTCLTQRERNLDVRPTLLEILLFSFAQ